VNRVDYAPRMLELAGEQTDGPVLWMTGPPAAGDLGAPMRRCADWHVCSRRVFRGLVPAPHY